MTTPIRVLQLTANRLVVFKDWLYVLNDLESEFPAVRVVVRLPTYHLPTTFQAEPLNQTRYFVAPAPLLAAVAPHAREGSPSVT